MRRNAVLFLGVLAAIPLLFQGPAAGYSTEVHRDFYDFAFGEGAGQQVQVPQTSDLEAFRRYFYDHAATNERFRARWPTFESFDAAAFKEFLGLNPVRAGIYGIDAAAPAGTDLRTAWREASIYPDSDRRNQDRLAVVNGQVLIGADGKAIPYDPRTVWFGGRTGTPSQFDAHGALSREPKKDSFWTALTSPQNFSRPPVVLGSAPEFSQGYTELAAIAELSGIPGHHWLGINFGGNNFHGIEDLGNQIHTTLIGIPEFFLDAKKVYYRHRIRSFFGGVGRWFSRLTGREAAAEAPTGPTVGPRGVEGVPPLTSIPVDELEAAGRRIYNQGTTEGIDPRVLYSIDMLKSGPPTDVAIGIRIIGTHHRLLEDFFEESYMAARELYRAGRIDEIQPPSLREVFRRAEAGDPAFEETLRQAIARAGNPPDRTEWARIIAEEMIRASAPEAAPCYRAIRAISRPDLKADGAYRPDAGDRPFDFVTTRTGRDVDRLFELHARAFARVVTALRLWRETFDDATRAAPGSPEAEATVQSMVSRLVARQMDYLDQAAARRLEYLRDVARRTGGNPDAVVDPLDPRANRGIIDAIQGANGAAGR